MSVVVRRKWVNRKAEHAPLRAGSLLSTIIAMWCFFLAGGSALYAESGVAAQVTSLYQTEVSVSSQSDADQKKALGVALSKVLVKVTGETRTLANERLQQAIKQPEKYVNGFSYRRETIDDQPHYFLQVTFVDASVNKLLREAGIAIWGANRPTTIVWLAIDDGRGRKIQPDSPTNPLVGNIDQRFYDRALPVIFPTMDLEDNAALSAVDVWGLFTDKIEKASVRYGTDVVLAGRLTVNNGRYNGRLSLLFRQDRQDAQVTELDGEQLSSVAADLVGSTLASHYAVASLDTGEQVALTIEQVTSVQDYSDLLNYLDKLTAVRSVKVRRVNGTTIDVMLMIDGYSSQLMDAISLGRSLRKIPARESTPMIDGQQKTTAHFRWVRR